MNFYYLIASDVLDNNIETVSSGKTINISGWKK